MYLLIDLKLYVSRSASGLLPSAVNVRDVAELRENCTVLRRANAQLANTRAAFRERFTCREGKQS